MSANRTRTEKVVVTIAAAAAVWVVGAAVVYTSGGINTSGLLPTAGCLIALWGAIRSDARLMWLGTGVVLVSALALVFSVGLVVAPAAIALVVGSLLLRSVEPSTSR